MFESPKIEVAGWLFATFREHPEKQQKKSSRQRVEPIFFDVSPGVFGVLEEFANTQKKNLNIDFGSSFFPSCSEISMQYRF